MQNLTQVQFTSDARNSTLETDDIPFRCAWVMTPEGIVRRSRIDTASGATSFRRNKTPQVAEGLGYVYNVDVEDALIANLDSGGPECEEEEREVWDEEVGLTTELVSLWKEEEPFVCPESVPPPRRVAKVVNMSADGLWVVSEHHRAVRTEKRAEATETVADACEESLPVRTYGERRVLFLVRSNHGGQPRLKKVDIRPPRLQSRAKPGERRMCANEGCHTEFLPPHNAPNATFCHSCHKKQVRAQPTRTCKSCGKSFRVPVNAPPDAELCPVCHKREREAAKRRETAKRARIESAQAVRQSKMVLIIKEAILHGSTLPEGAEIKKDDGRQVIVLFQGKSYTVYRMRYGKTERKRRARRFCYGRAA